MKLVKCLGNLLKHLLSMVRDKLYNNYLQPKKLGKLNQMLKQNSNILATVLRYFSTDRHIPDKASCTSPVDLNATKKKLVQKFIKTLDNIVTDCDGVLWHESGPIPGSADTLNYFRKIGKKVYFVTNNSRKTRKELLNQALDQGVKANLNEIILPSYTIAHYLKFVKFTRKAYVLGSKAIGKELDSVGIKHFGIGPDVPPKDFKSVVANDLDPDTGAVVVGYDIHFNYIKLMKAASYLTSKKCLFLGTNPEVRKRLEGPLVRPGAGSFIKAVEAAANRKATMVGKPFPYVRKVIQSYCAEPDKTLMIGDSIKSGIKFGSLCGFRTLLVMSGNTTPEMLSIYIKEKKIILPDVYISKLGDLLPILSSK